MSQLPIGNKVTATIVVTDAKDNPTRVDGVPVWSTDRPDVLTIEAAADGLSAVVTPTGALGSAQVQVDADADLGEGVRPLTLLGTVEVVAGEAVAGTIDFGPLEPA